MRWVPEQALPRDLTEEGGPSRILKYSLVQSKLGRQTQGCPLVSSSELQEEHCGVGASCSYCAEQGVGEELVSGANAVHIPLGLVLSCGSRRLGGRWLSLEACPVYLFCRPGSIPSPWHTAR